MTETSFALSLLIGVAFGITYGFFYLFSKKRILIAKQRAVSKKDLYLIYANSFIRIGFIGVFIYLLLLSPSMHFILTIACFLASFWAIILFKKAY